MTVAKSIKRKPDKPRPDWPLTASSNGQWVKKIKGKVYAFGRWDEPDEALKRYTEQHDYIRAHGCRPIDDDSIRLDNAVKAFLERQRDRRDGVVGKKISPRHFEDLKASCGLALKTFQPSRRVGTLRPDDFARLYKQLSVRKEPDADGGLLASSSTIQRNIANVKAFFNWLAKERLIPHRLEYGSDFVAPATEKAQDELETAK